ncbi:hypothetical protein AAF712_000796 [Marasmius tenuissimus]|uniref:Uncharacterized protein n=1 Tax=Marasmius tenuissimus TaxID=585030 RepID=A0ABR3AFW7_9AGAR
MLPLQDVAAPSRPASFTDLANLLAGGKGKSKEVSEPESSPQRPQVSLPAWFLDVASPTWDDMRAIGRLLHLHPLTLEDILQKEPREKLEAFPKLGYSFISFRAVESQTFREKARQHKLDTTNEEDEEGLMGEANVYLVIFNEGICLFHFMDISEHTERVRNKLISFAESTTMSSAWIAHGLLDSIVDSFFPCLDEIEKEIANVEELVFEGDRTNDTQTPVQPEDTQSTTRRWIPKLPSFFGPSESTIEGTELVKIPSSPSSPPLEKEKEKDETDTYRGSLATKTRFALPRPPMALMQKRFLRFFRSRFRLSKGEKSSPPSTTYVNLRRIARTRKLVTSLTRVLASKADVIAQIRKRMVSGLGGASSAEDLEVAIYMGDVQGYSYVRSHTLALHTDQRSLDHILTLQHSLSHYDRMLNQSYPIYLRQLRMQLAFAKSNTDKALIMLTTVSIAILCAQSVIGK